MIGQCLNMEVQWWWVIILPILTALSAYAGVLVGRYNERRRPR